MLLLLLCVMQTHADLLAHRLGPISVPRAAAAATAKLDSNLTPTLLLSLLYFNATKTCECNGVV